MKLKFCLSSCHIHYLSLHALKIHCVKKKIFIFLLTLISQFALAQAGGQKPGIGKMPAIGHIYGKIIDAKTKEAVPFASVAIFKKDSVIAGNFTKTNGEFSLEGLPYGRFTLKISFLGFKTLERPLAIVPKDEEQDLGDIQLSTEETQLKAAEVVEEKSAVEFNIDRKVFNVDKNIVSKGGTATDVMKNIPSVTLDENGNAQLRQNSATIYVDGRPTTLTLDQIPADQIDKVEVITNPSVKFEASATGGIINIVMKGNTKLGYNGIVGGGIGTNDHYNGIVALNFKQKPIGVSLNYNYGTFMNPINAYALRTNLFNGSKTGEYDSYNDKVFRNTLNSVSVNVDYFLNNRNTISLGGNYTEFYLNTSENQRFTTTDAQNAVENYGSRITHSMTRFMNYSGKLHYRKTFPKKGKELNGDFNTSIADGTNPSDYTTTTYGNDGKLLANNPDLQNNKAINISQVYLLQIDYVNPINDSNRIELGIRSQYKPSNQAMDVTRYNYPSEGYTVDTYLTNHYHIDDLVNAAYINYTTRFKKIGYMFGLRFEDSYYKGVLLNKNDSTFHYNFPSSFDNLLNSLFPAIYMSKKLTDKKELQFNVSRKINRPDFRQVMPFITSSDKKNLSIGNPSLTPEFITLAELNYNQVLSKGNFIATLFYRNTQNVLSPYSYRSLSDSSVLISTTINGKQSNTVGMDYIVKYNFIKNFETTLSVNLFYTSISASYKNVSVSNQGFYYTSKLNLVYRFPKNFSLQLSGSYESAQAIAQGKKREQYFADCGISKEVLKFMTFTVSVSDIFDTKGRGILTTTNEYIQDYWSRRETRYVKFTAMIRFGKSDASPFKRKAQNSRADEGGDSGDY